VTITGSNTTNFGFQKLGSNDSAGYSTINEVVDGIDTILNASDRLIKAAQTPTVAYVITGDGTDWVRGLVVTASITDLNVTTGKLADLSVTTGKIAASAVTSAKIDTSVALPGQPTVGTATGSYPVSGSDSRIASVKYVNDAAASLTAGTSFVVGGDLSGTTGAATIVTGAVTSAKILDNTIVLGDLATALQAFLTPTGALMPFAGLAASAPTGWLICDGSSYAASGASAGLQSLLNAAGWSALPDLRGRTIVGTGTGAGLTARSLRDVFGAQSAALTSGNLPAHTHTVSQTSTGAYSTRGIVNYLSTAGGGSAATVYWSSQTAGLPGDNNYISTAGNHTHSVSVSGGGNGTSTGTAFDTIQPSIALNYIIKN
tara:strand:- start:2582 stop:3700 length:1119 start_codon:yes stop_codon:yes gene_type:complete